MKICPSDTTDKKYDPLHQSIIISTMVFSLIRFLITDYFVSIWIVRILAAMCVLLLLMHRNILKNSKNSETLALLSIPNSEKLIQISKLSFQTKEIINLLVISQVIIQGVGILINYQVLGFISSLFFIFLLLFSIFLISLFFMKKHQIDKFKKEIFNHKQTTMK